MRYGGATAWARQTVTSEVFLKKPDKWFKIWFYIVTRANYKTARGWNRGECFMQSSEIESATGASQDQVKKCLKWLRDERSINTRRSTRGMYIKVLKYNVYQDFNNYNTSPGEDEHRGRTERGTEVSTREIDKTGLDIRLNSTSSGSRSTREALEKHQRSTTIGEEGKNGKNTTEPSSEDLKANQKDMSWNKIADDFEEELQVDPDYVPKGKPKKTKKVSDDVQAVFDLFNNPASALWRMREIERVAAQALFDTYGLETLKKRIARIEKEKKNDDPLFPLVVTPSQLLDKMPNVERYFKL